MDSVLRAADRPALGIRAAILYERFDDQRNIVRVLHAGSGRQKTLYFAAPDDGWSEVRDGTIGSGPT